MVTPEITRAFVRVYIDLHGETNAKLEALAKANGRTKKGQLEMLVNEAVAEFDAKEKETSKRAKKAEKK
jgi:hypothetical protein